MLRAKRVGQPRLRVEAKRKEKWELLPTPTPFLALFALRTHARIHLISRPRPPCLHPLPAAPFSGGHPRSRFLNVNRHPSPQQRHATSFPSSGTPLSPCHAADLSPGAVGRFRSILSLPRLVSLGFFRVWTKGTDKTHLAAPQFLFIPQILCKLGRVSDRF